MQEVLSHESRKILRNFREEERWHRNSRKGTSLLRICKEKTNWQSRNIAGNFFEKALKSWESTKAGRKRGTWKHNLFSLLRCVAPQLSR